MYRNSAFFREGMTQNASFVPMFNFLPDFGSKIRFEIVNCRSSCVSKLPIYLLL